MKEMFYNIKNGELPVPGSKVFIRLDEEATRGYAYPEASIVSVQTWRDGHIHFIKDSGEQYMEFFPQYIKDWCYLSDLMKLH